MIILGLRELLVSGTVGTPLSLGMKIPPSPRFCICDSFDFLTYLKGLKYMSSEGVDFKYFLVGVILKNN